MELFAACALWGVCATAFNVASQAEVIRITPPEASSVAMSLFSGLFNIGIGAGSALGGAVCDTLGIGLIGVIGDAIAAAGAVYCALRLTLFCAREATHVIPLRCPRYRAANNARAGR